MQFLKNKKVYLNLLIDLDGLQFQLSTVFS